MNNPLHVPQDGDGHPDELLHLKLEGLLPANQELVINPALRTATLLSHVPDGRAEMVVQQHFSPNGLRVLVPLLRAYPEMCLNEVLFANLFSLPLDQAYQQMREMRALTIRSVHRAISTLRVKLRVFGWGIGSIRGEGYLLRPLIKAQG
jgi:hypothetical protein